MRAAAFGLVLLACRAQTGVLITVARTGDIDVDQLQISGEGFTPGALPEPPRLFKSHDETVALLLAESLGGRSIEVRVDAVRSGARVGSAAGKVEVRVGRMVPLALALGPPAVCGDGKVNADLEACDDGNLLAGDGCSTTCDIENGFTCSATAGGAASVCTGGCGGAAPCAVGQICRDGACVCDAESCPAGCCQGGSCLPGSDAAACGAAGNNCQACPAPQTCGAGACSGCAATCPIGCCSGSTCVSAALPICGSSGAACKYCDETRSDNCAADGACACGSSAACPAGQRCAAGSCGCSAQSCPNGCCDNGVCVSPDATRCGSSGAACIACASGESCVGGTCSGCLQSCGGCCSGSTCVATPTFPKCNNSKVCVTCDTRSNGCRANGTCGCGTGAPCGVGEKCVGALPGGTCMCDTTTGCDGCCKNGGTTCVPLVATTKSTCGKNGASCTGCFGSKSCTAGVCK